MPSTRVAKPPTPFKSTLEAASFDWRSARVQFGLGFTLTLMAFSLFVQDFFATRFLPSEYLAFGKLLTEYAPLLLTRANSAFTFEQLTATLSSPQAFLQYAELLFFRHHSWWYRTICFSASLLSALATGLIALEVGIRYGNRIGGASGVFAALLFVAMPQFNAVTIPASMFPVLLSNALGLFAIFLDLRYRLVQEPRYYRRALFCLILCGALDVRGAVIATLGLLLSRALIKENEKWQDRSGPLYTYIGATIYFLVCILFLAPHLALMGGDRTAIAAADPVSGFLKNTGVFPMPPEAVPIRWLQKLMPGVFAAAFAIGIARLVIGSVWLRPLFFAASWLATSLLSWQLLQLGDTAYGSYPSTAIFICSPLALCLALWALPAVDTLKRKTRVALTALGSLVLSAIVTGWGISLAVQLEQNQSAATELNIFKVQLARRLESTAGKLAVINPPFHLAQQQSNSPEFDAIELRSDEQVIFNAILNSPMSAQKVPMAPQRNRPINFVRLSKTGATPPDPGNPETLVTDFYVWTSGSRQLIPIYYAGAAELSINMDEKIVSRIKTEPEQVATIKADEWAQAKISMPYIEIEQNALRLNSGNKDDLIVWFPHKFLDPTKAGKVIVKGARRDVFDKSPLLLVFKGKDSDDVGVLQLNRTRDLNETRFEATTKGVADWNKHSGIVALGIKLPAAGKSIVVRSIETTRGAK